MTGVIIGGDIRQFYLARALQQKGFFISGYRIVCPNHEEEIPQVSNLLKSADFWILPVPISTDKKTVRLPDCQDTLLLDEMVSAIKKGDIVFGGLFPEDFLHHLNEKGAKCVDFMNNNKVALKNAVATAEGTIVEAILAGTENLHGSQCLVLGYGRCAQVLVNKLKGISCDVTVMCRNPEAIALAQTLGVKALKISDNPSDYREYRYIFNTIPARVLTKENLNECRMDVVIIDIASKPGGTDFAYCAKKKLNAKLCGSLPGIYAPKTSGEILAEAVAEELNTNYRQE